MPVAKPSDIDVNRLSDKLVAQLKSSLGRHGITLPSLRADHPVANQPLIDLGRCNQQTAEAMIAVLDSITPRG
ncbi:hypothetical protein ABIA32_000451 [Streptacidiphilus sp. MAP12-20]|uniref:hypothetical protein n=1 Tax=Streptacidiphilus sp. MAP12-20 TaxID=3156299 RepID=UPI003514FDA8